MVIRLVDGPLDGTKHELANPFAGIPGLDGLIPGAVILPVTETARAFYKVDKDSMTATFVGYEPGVLS